MQDAQTDSSPQDGARAPSIRQEEPVEGKKSVDSAEQQLPLRVD